ncbi:MAG: hypothetical protein R2862_02645 [Thermoanaerobaculia bacterium]
MHRIRRRTPHRAALAAAFLLAGPLTAGTVLVDAGRGNVIVRIPDTGTPPYPLVVFLHGYSSSGNESDAFFQFGNHAEVAGMPCSRRRTGRRTSCRTGSGTRPTPAATSSAAASTTPPTSRDW